MEPIPEYIAYAGRFREVLEGSSTPVDLFRVIVDIRKAPEEVQRRKTLVWAIQAADTEMKAFAESISGKVFLPETGRESVDPIIINRNLVQVTWVVL